MAPTASTPPNSSWIEAWHLTDLTDPLTGLHSRPSFLSLLRRHIGYANDRQKMLALIIVDINGFAQINGTSGFAFGDLVLRHMADQLREVARKHDYCARIGDNRFALLLPTILNAGHAELAVQKLFRQLELPVQSDDRRLTITANAGVALCPTHATHPEFLMRVAEMAMITARHHGSRYVFAPEQAHAAPLSAQWDLELELSQALDRGEFQMYYQPQIRFTDGSVAGVEALMRWESRTRGMVPPNIFVPVAERIGQLKKMTNWALNTVLRQAARWEHPWGTLSAAVNISGDLSIQGDLPEIVENSLKLWGSEGVQLVLEITEGSLMDRRHALDVLGRIRDLGVRISLDDFGTGYSCLAYFRNIPVDELKIDKSFVQGFLSDGASADITTLIIDLAHRFNLTVVAEGIEHAETFDALKAGGCDVAQGYLFGKPMPAAEFQKWLDRYGQPGRKVAAH
jgi:diguanylate cyclase (GGDEF)-like protein